MNNDINNSPHDDPKLTAYVLGELNDTERAEFEALLESDPAARLAVDELRSTADLLGAELASEPCPSLTDEQRAKIQFAGDAPAPEIRTFKFPRMWIGSGLAAAAALAIAFVVIQPKHIDSARSSAVTGGKLNSESDKALNLQSRQSEGMPPPAMLDSLRAGVAVERKDDRDQLGLSLKELGKSPADLSKPADQELAFRGKLAESMQPVDAGTVAASPSGTPNGPGSAEPASTQYHHGLASRNGGAPVQGATADSKSVGGAGEPSGTIHVTSGTFPPTPGGDSNGSGDELRRAEAAEAGRGISQGGGFGGGGGGGPVDGNGMPGKRKFESAKAIKERLELPWQTGRAGGDYDDENKLRNDYRRMVPGIENYARIVDNPFLGVTESPLSTFSTDVDTASYSNMRRFLAGGSMPPPDAVRIEELVNYFRYDYAPPAKDADAPFAAHIEVNACPWSPTHRLVRVGLKGREVAMDQRPATNLVFLIDTSGSMQPHNKLPLLKQSLNLLVDQLNGDDRMAIVTYAGTSGLALPSTYCTDKAAIKAQIDNLQAGGSTHGSAGIRQAYDVATEHLIQGGVNRVILATDGDFNVGISDEAGLVQLIEQKRATGVSLSVLGFGEGNLQDAKMEKLADHGNGNYAYIDSLREGRKVLVEQATGTLVTIAKDVKFQIEFNPLQVAAYRLIGYENRVLAAQDFNDDRKDAGEIGAGHTVTALYEIVPIGAVAPVDQQITDLQKQIESIDQLIATAQLSGAAMAELQQKRTEAQAKLAFLKNVSPPPPPAPPVDPLKYQKAAAPPPPPAPAPAAEPTDAAISGELLTLKLRYKQPEGDISKLIEFPVKAGDADLSTASSDFRFATAVASFGMILRNSPYRGTATLATVLELAQSGRGEDEGGYRAEFIDLVMKAKALRGE